MARTTTAENRQTGHDGDHYGRAMTTDNTEVIRRAWATFGRRDASAIAACFHPDARWTAPAGNATAVAIGGDSDMIGRDAIARFLATDMYRLYRDIRVEFHSLSGAGDLVTLEETMSAVLPDGRPYVNDYCFVFEVRDGLIHRVREYMDTARAARTVFAA